MEENLFRKQAVLPTMLKHCSQAVDKHWIKRRRTACWSRKLGTWERVKAKKLSMDKVKSYESFLKINH